MIAEIKGKISSINSNLRERLEDNLTGNFFGALRYLPFFKGLKVLLTNTKFLSEKEKTDFNNFLNSNQITIEHKNFWPSEYRNEHGEIDLLFQEKKFILGIEVKYISNLSSDDEIKNDQEENYLPSNNQLSRYSRLLNSISKSDDYKVLIFLAPSSIAKKIIQDATRRNIIQKSIAFGYINWEDVLDCFSKLNLSTYTPEEKNIIFDICEYLKRKGFEKFTGFEIQTPLESQAYIYSANNLIFPKETLTEDIYEFKSK